MTKGKIANEIVSKKIKVVQEFLMKYVDPKPEWSGMFASSLAVSIINAISDVDNMAMGDDMEINLGLNAQEEAEALDAIEHGSEATLSDEKPH